MSNHWAYPYAHKTKPQPHPTVGWGFVMSGGVTVAKWGGPRVTRLRQLMEQELPVRCWRCGDWIMPGSAWTIGHIVEVDRAPELMWDRENHRHEHAACNFRAGAVYGNRKRGRAAAADPTSRRWVR